jgi:hypothetical protein
MDDAEEWDDGAIEEPRANCTRTQVCWTLIVLAAVTQLVSVCVVVLVFRPLSARNTSHVSLV